jgi:hypothetical protein
MACKQPPMFGSAVPGFPGHSFCASSSHLPNAPWARRVAASAFAWPSAHGSPSRQRISGGKFVAARWALIFATHASWKVDAVGLVGCVLDVSLPPVSPCDDSEFDAPPERSDPPLPPDFPSPSLALTPRLRDEASPVDESSQPQSKQRVPRASADRWSMRPRTPRPASLGASQTAYASSFDAKPRQSNRPRGFPSGKLRRSFAPCRIHRCRPDP